LMALPLRINRGPTIAPLDLVRNDFDTMLSHLFGRGLFGDGSDAGAGALASLGNYGVDIREDADHVYVVADLPGFRKEDVDISLENGTLTITAERREEVEVPPSQRQPGQEGAERRQAQPAKGEQQQQAPGEQPGEYLLRERRVQRFVRSFTLPPNVDEQNVQARLEN